MSSVCPLPCTPATTTISPRWTGRATWSTVSWLKLHVDDDTRYRQFLCPGPRASTLGEVSDYRNTCRY